MATIDTTTNGNPFEYPGQTLLIRFTPKVLPGVNHYLCLVQSTTANTYVLRKGKGTYGSDWSEAYLTITRANIVDIGAIYADTDDKLWWAYRTNESSQDRIYLRRIHTANTADTSWQTEVLLANPGNGGVAGSVYTSVDVVAQPVDSTRRVIAVAVGGTSGGSVTLEMLGGNWNGSSLTAANYIFSGTRKWSHSGAAGRCGVSMDVSNTGDGYTSSVKKLWVAYGRDKLRLVVVPWSGAGWTGSSSETVINDAAGTINQHCVRYSSNRAFMVIPDPVNTDQVVMYERDSANSTTLTRRTGSHPQGVVRNCHMAADYRTNNVRVWAVGTSTAVLYQNDFNYGTGAWSGWASTGLPAIMGSNVDNYGAKRGTFQDSRWGLYTAAAGAPNTLTWTPLALAYAPNAPVWLTPKNGAAADVGAALALSWQFSDNDPGDTQSAFAVSRQIGTGSLTYWRASDNTWQTSEVQNTSSTSGITVPTGWALTTDPTYSFKVKVWDAANTASGYSAALQVLPSTPVNPVINTPTPSQVISTTYVTTTWTVAEQTQYRVTLSIQGGALLFDSGFIGDGFARTYQVPYVLANGAYTVTVQTSNNKGLPSVIQSQNFSVNFTPPATPTLVITASIANGYISAAVTNPTPSGGQPVVQYQDIYRRKVGDTSAGVRVATQLPNGPVTYNDWQAVSAVTYEFQVLVFGINGASSASAWTQ